MSRRQLSSSYYVEWDREYVMHPYTSMTTPLPTYPVRKAQGVHIELEDGRRLIDGMSSWWAAVHGYRHPSLDEAMKEQMQSMSHVMFGGLCHEPASKLGKLLVDITPPGLDKVFLCDSGSVSIEVAMKMAVQYWFTEGKPQKSRFLTIANGYHGDTFGAMSVCDPVNGMHSMFQGILAKNIFVPSPNGCSEDAAGECIVEIEKALQREARNISAIILEPIVQGAGGMRIYSPSVLRKVRKLCDEYEVLLIFDEIATGFGRTGALFACEQSRATSFDPMLTPCQAEICSCRAMQKSEEVQQVVVPDILCLGKALTGGYLTMGATLANGRVCEGISGKGGVFMHGPTFMGNPLACSVALASINLLLSSPWRERVDKVANVLKRELEPLAELPEVKQVRVLGAIGVCELKEPVKDMARIQQEFVNQGVWLRPFGKLLYTMPPFNAPELDKSHVEEIAKAIRNCIPLAS